MVPMTNNTYKDATVEDVPDEAEVTNTDSWSEVGSLYPISARNDGIEFSVSGEPIADTSLVCADIVSA